MSNRCPDCSKFVSLEIQEPEVSSLEIAEDGNINADVRVYLTCADCGTEMKEYTFNIDEIPDEVFSHIEEHNEAGEEYSLEIEENGVDMVDEMQTHDRHGNPIKNYRYQKHYYGFELTALVTCSCGEEIEVSFTDKEQASAFDELN